MYALSACVFSLHPCFFAGQNKNRFVLAYFMWRTMVGLHNKVSYLMQVPGHARCLVDAGFGHAKKLYRRSDCDTLADVERVFANSSTTNEAVVYKQENGANEWEWRAWKSFLGEHFKPFVGIRKYQQFQFDASRPGIVVARKGCGQPDEEFHILKNPEHRFASVVRPPVVQPGGLSSERARYLFKKVRPYVRPCHQDSTCPRPSEE
jgi:hypothetical protein